VAIAPGLFDTPMTASLPERDIESLSHLVLYPKRLGHPSEVAALVSHAVSNGYINATTLSIDGGIRLA
jgi:NAD(P)-dependent dehydrogenase (short-subunit alcohol dehydrogenase family)